MNKDGSCHTSIVSSVVQQLHDVNVKNIIVRSTVPVGFCDKNQCFFMPEFITEKNWKNDVKIPKIGYWVQVKIYLMKLLH